MRVEVTSGELRGMAVEIADRPLAIGRDDSCDLTLPDPEASRHHATLTPNPDGTLTLQDHDSTNGTYVDDHRITTPTTLTGGEHLRIGTTTLTLLSSAQTPETPAPPAEPPRPASPSAARPSGPRTPSRIERIALRSSIRRSRWIAVVAGVGAIAAVVVLVLYATGVIFGTDDALSSAEIVDRTASSTVQVVAVRGEQTADVGSGWVYDAAGGLVVTSATSIGFSTEWAVRLGDESRKREATLVAAAPCQDVALLRVADTAGMTTMALGSQADLVRGEDVVALGYPVAQLSPGGRLVANEGVVSVPSAATNQPGLPRLTGVILTDLSLNPGNEGGPLVDRTAKLVGMNVRFRAGGFGAQGQSYAIGVDRLTSVVPGLAEGRSIAWTGMEFDVGLDEAALAELGLPAVAGLVVTRAVPGTTAAEAGFGSIPVIVVAVNGQTLDGTLASYCNVAGELTGDDSATFTYVQSGETEPRSFTLRFD